MTHEGAKHVIPANGGSLQFNNVAGGAGGSRTLTARFANGSGSSRTGRLVVNGAGQNITTPATGSWATWQTMSLTVPLNAGTGNTIRFESTGQDLANIDHIVVAARMEWGQ
jgi:rhamnogalacturonan endolyase